MAYRGEFIDERFMLPDPSIIPQERIRLYCGNHCPHCGRDTLRIVENTTEHSVIIHRDIACAYCGSTWTEKLKVVGLSNIIKRRRETDVPKRGIFND